MQSTLLAEVLTQSSEQTTSALTELPISVAMLVGLLKGVLVQELLDASEKTTDPLPILKEILNILLATAPELAIVLITFLLHTAGLMEAQMSVDSIVLSLSSATITTLTLLANYYKNANSPTKNS